MRGFVQNKKLHEWIKSVIRERWAKELSALVAKKDHHSFIEDRDGVIYRTAFLFIDDFPYEQIYCEFPAMRRAEVAIMDKPVSIADAMRIAAFTEVMNAATEVIEEELNPL